MKKKETILSASPTHDLFVKKIQAYCAYQERCQQEVRDKLFELGADQIQIEEIIVQLIADNFLNEERFAIQYCRGKFRIKGWGKRKIQHALQFKKVSEPCINKGLSEIDDQEYCLKLKETYNKLSKEKKTTITEQQKIIRQLLSKGFEMDLIIKNIKETSH